VGNNLQISETKGFKSFSLPLECLLNLTFGAVVCLGGCMVFQNREYRASLANAGMRNFLRLLVPVAALMFALTMVTSARADERVGMLHPIGSVTVNDAAAARPVALFDGDRVATGAAGSATIVSEGTQVFVPENSTVMYMQHEVVVLKNRAVITTLNGMSARAGGLKVAPEASESTQFSLVRDDAATTVRAITGSVSLRDADGAMPLNAGNSMRVDAFAAASEGGKQQSFFHSISGEESGDWFGGGGGGGGHHRFPPPPPPPPRRCHRPPESPTHHCDPFHDPFHCCFHDGGHGGW
jgi:hypothetical protein